MTSDAVGVGDDLGARPDYGPTWADLRCTSCHATWVGHPGEPCPWCQRRLRQLRTEQARLTLQPPDIDPDDTRYEDAMKAWGGRLRRAVKAGIIPRHRATAAWRRKVQRGAA